MANEHIPHASHDHLRNVIDRYDLTKNPGPLSRFSYNFSTIRIKCLPHNHPGGLWDWFDFYRHPASPYNISPYETLGDVHPILDADERIITAFIIQTKADGLVSQHLISETAFLNRPDDLLWVEEQLAWLWEQAFPGTPLPPVSVTDWQADPSDTEDLADWVFYNAGRKPGEPLSKPPTPTHPRPF